MKKMLVMLLVRVLRKKKVKCSERVVQWWFTSTEARERPTRRQDEIWMLAQFGSRRSLVRVAVS